MQMMFQNDNVSNVFSNILYKLNTNVEPSSGIRSSSFWSSCPCPSPLNFSQIKRDHVHVHATFHDFVIAMSMSTPRFTDFFMTMSMSTPRFSKNFVSMPRPWPWRGHGHRCPFSTWPCPPNSGQSISNLNLITIHFDESDKGGPKMVSLYSTILMPGSRCLPRDLSPTFKTCNQHIRSPTSLTIIDATILVIFDSNNRPVRLIDVQFGPDLVS